MKKLQFLYLLGMMIAGCLGGVINAAPLTKPVAKAKALPLPVKKPVVVPVLTKEQKIYNSLTRVLRLRKEMGALEKELQNLESLLATQPKNPQTQARFLRQSQIEARLVIVRPAIDQEEVNLKGLLATRDYPRLILPSVGKVVMDFGPSKNIIFGDAAKIKPGTKLPAESVEYSEVTGPDGKKIVFLNMNSSLRFTSTKNTKGGPGKTNNGDSTAIDNVTNDEEFTLTKNNLGQLILTFNTKKPITISNTPNKVKNNSDNTDNTDSGDTLTKTTTTGDDNFEIVKGKNGETLLVITIRTPLVVANDPDKAKELLEENDSPPVVDTVDGGDTTPPTGTKDTADSGDKEFTIIKGTGGTTLLVFNTKIPVTFNNNPDKVIEEEKVENKITDTPPGIPVPTESGTNDTGSKPPPNEDEVKITKLSDGSSIMTLTFGHQISFSAKEESFEEEVGKKPETVEEGYRPPIIDVPGTNPGTDTTEPPGTTKPPAKSEPITLNFSSTFTFQAAEEEAEPLSPLVLRLDALEVAQGGVPAPEKMVQGQKAFVLTKDTPGWLSMRATITPQTSGTSLPDGLTLKITAFPSNCDGLLAPGTDLSGAVSGGKASIETGTDGVKEFPAAISQCLLRFAILTDTGDRAEIASMTWRSAGGTVPVEGQILPLSLALDSAPPPPASVTPVATAAQRSSKRIAVGDSDTAEVKLDGYADYVFDLVADNRPYDLEISATSGGIAAFGLIGGEALPSRDSALISSGDISSGGNKTLRFSKSEGGSPTLSARVAILGRSVGGSDPIRFTVSLKSVDKSIAQQGLGGTESGGLKVLGVNPASAAPGDLVTLQVEGASPDPGSLMVLFQGAAELKAESSSLLEKPQTVAVRVPQGAQSGEVKIRSAGALSETGAFLTVGGLSAPVSAAPSGCTGGIPAFSVPVITLAKAELIGNELDSSTGTIAMAGTAVALPNGLTYLLTADKGFLSVGGAEVAAGQSLTVSTTSGTGNFTYRSPFLSVNDPALLATGGTTAKLSVQAVIPGQDAEGCLAEKTISLKLLAPPGVPEVGQ